MFTGNSAGSIRDCGRSVVDSRVNEGVVGDPLRHADTVRQFENLAWLILTHWIVIELVDENGKPVPDEDYRITLPDGSVVEGSLDSKGKARIDGIDSGTCKVSFLARDRDDWKRQ